MSAPNPKPTRQQLEELDALLQRMLSLPTNQLESEMSGRFAAAPSVQTQAAPPSPPMYSAPPSMARPAMAPAPQPMPPSRRAEPPRGENAWQIPLPAAGGVGIWPGSVDPASSGAPVGASRIPASAMPMNRLNVTTVPSPDEANRLRDMAPVMAQPQGNVYAGPMIQMPAPLQPPMEQSLPFFLWPFGLIDRSVGDMMAAFGLPGRWFGQGGGKILVGWAGLLMLGGAAAWGVMDYLGLSW